MLWNQRILISHREIARVRAKTMKMLGEGDRYKSALDMVIWEKLVFETKYQCFVHKTGSMKSALTTLLKLRY